jgi:hypothetical protein
MDPILQPCDVFLTRGTSLVSCLIRFFTRSFGERRTLVNHVGVIVQQGTRQTAVGVEALSRVRRHTLWSQYGPRSSDLVAVYRPQNLSAAEQAAIVAAAQGYVGRTYGYLAVAAHVLDWCLLGAYFARRLVRMDRYPICSWLVAHAFGKADKHFGVAAGMATPDDIWDFVTTRPRSYTLIRPLNRLR